MNKHGIPHPPLGDCESVVDCVDAIEVGHSPLVLAGCLLEAPQRLHEARFLQVVVVHVGFGIDPNEVVEVGLVDPDIMSCTG